MADASNELVQVSLSRQQAAAGLAVLTDVPLSEEDDALAEQAARAIQSALDATYNAEGDEDEDDDETAEGPDDDDIDDEDEDEDDA